MFSTNPKGLFSPKMRCAFCENYMSRVFKHTEKEEYLLEDRVHEVYSVNRDTARCAVCPVKGAYTKEKTAIPSGNVDMQSVFSDFGRI